MEKYTKEQLIDAMEQYYINYHKNTAEFTEYNKENPKEDAVNTVEYLISLIENN